MSDVSIALLTLCCLAVLLAPRQWAPLPLLVCALYIPLEVGFTIGSINVFALRVVLAIAGFRVLLRRETIHGGLNGIDRAFLWWSAAALLTSFAHADPASTLVNRLGWVYNACGTYFVLRIFCRSADDVDRMCRTCVWLLVPVALEMLQELQTGRNLFSAFGGIYEMSEVRNGRLRAQGPFNHSILAGSVAAACLPLAAAFWSQRRWTSVAGIAACLTMVYASGSSGPVIGTLFGLIGLAAWKYREKTRSIRWLLVVAYLGLELVMNAPAYYILTRMDVTGSSTSWHRAALIEAALAHLPEWWLVGTDYTRHWLAYGVLWSGNQADITNYYLRMGVDGGLPLLLTFVLVLARGFSTVGRSWRRLAASASPHVRAFLPWALGASLLSHAANFVGVSYFDQSVVFLYLTLAGIGSVAAPAAAPMAQAKVPPESPGYIALLRP